MLREKPGCTFPLHCMRLEAITILLVLAAWFGPIGVAHAGTTVRVVETWPAGGDVVLGRNQNFYLRLAYDTDKPVGIWVMPYFHGKPAKVGSSPSQTYSGSGETFGWFFFMQPGEAVDEIRVTAGDGGRTARRSSLPGAGTWWLAAKPPGSRRGLRGLRI